MTLSVDGKIKNVTVSYKISLAEGVAYVKLAYDLDVTYKVKGDYIPASCISNINDITFVYWGVPGVGGFKITYDVELSGSFSGVQSWQSCVGASDMHLGSCRSCGAAFCRGCLRAFTAQMAPPMKSGRSIWH